MFSQDMFLTHQILKQYFSDFREKFGSYSLRLLEFKSIKIFAISLFLTILGFFGFLTLYFYLIKKLPILGGHLFEI